MQEDDHEQSVSEGKAWVHEYINSDVEKLQMMKQHHVHLRILIRLSESRSLPAVEKITQLFANQNFQTFRGSSNLQLYYVKIF